MESVAKTVTIELIEGSPLYRVYPVIVEFAQEYGRHIYIEERDFPGRKWGLEAPLRVIHVANHEPRERIRWKNNGRILFPSKPLCYDLYNSTHS